MKSKKMKSTIAMGIITALILFIIYYLFYISVTNLTAQNQYQIIKEKEFSLVENILDTANIEAGFDTSNATALSNRPGYEEYTMLKIMKEISEKITLDEYEIPVGSMQMSNPEKTDIETAALFQDASGNVLFHSGDYIFFPYTTEELWEHGEDQNIGYAYINLNDIDNGLRDWFAKSWLLTQESDEFHVRDAWIRHFGRPNWQEELAKEIEAKDTSKVQIRKMKITGQIQDAKIIPSRIDVLTEGSMIKHGINYNQILTQDLTNSIPWERIYESPSSDSDTLITIYASDPEITFYPQENDLLTVLISKNFAPFNERRNLNSLVYQSNRFIEIGENNYNLVYAISGSPMNTAKNELKYVYNWARILLILTWLSLNLIIYLKLIRPVAMVNQAFEDGMKYIWKEKTTKSLWCEQTELIRHYLSMRNGTFKHKTETDDLKNALSSANEAEENRREMVSNLAHDLKNPMSIIYTYSEALKENISEEKNEEYYEVILSEIKHMEEMVVDMLDLSHKKDV